MAILQHFKPRRSQCNWRWFRIYLPTYHSISQLELVKYTCIYCGPLLDRLNWCKHNNLAKKSTVGLISVVESLRLQSSRLFCSWHHHGSFNAFLQKVILPEGSTFWLINPVELTRYRHLSFSLVGIVKTENDFFSLKDSLQT